MGPAFSLIYSQIFWILLSLAGILGLSFFWLGEARLVAPHPDEALNRQTQFTVAILFLMSYPAMFALERGSTDIPVLALYSAGALFLRRKIWWALGAVSVTAALLKVYPLFPALALSMAAVFIILKSCFAKSRFS